MFFSVIYLQSFSQFFSLCICFHLVILLHRLITIIWLFFRFCFLAIIYSVFNPLFGSIRYYFPFYFQTFFHFFFFFTFSVTLLSSLLGGLCFTFSSSLSISFQFYQVIPFLCGIAPCFQQNWTSQDPLTLFFACCADVIFALRVEKLCSDSENDL